MYNPQTIDRVKEIITPIFDSQAVELVDLTCRRRGGRMVLRLLVDKTEGITLKECSDLNQKVSRLLDNSSFICHSYTLEVSSPGLDRPLSSEQDLRRVQGRLVRIITSEPIHGRSQYTGIVTEVNEEKVIIEIDKRVTVEIPLDKITKARQEIQF